MLYHFTTEELETHIWRDGISKDWVAETNIAQDYRKFKKQGWEVEQEEFYEDGTFRSAKFRARYEAIRIAPAKKKEISEEQLAVLRARMEKARNQQKK